MPYICLARNDIPDGEVQILDLKPNTSQPQPRTAQGQTKYVNRAVSGTAAGSLNAAVANTLTTTQTISGLTAYLLDCWASCGGASSTARISFAANLNGGDTLVFTTAAGSLTLTAGVEFAVGGSAALTATNLLNYMTSGPGIAAFDGAIGFHFSGATTVADIDIATSAAGPASFCGLTTNAAARIKFYWGGNTVVTTRTRLTQSTWNLNTLSRAVDGILGLVDTGLNPITNDRASTTLALSAVNTASNPMILTTATSHGLTSGDAVWLTGLAGASAGSVNGRNWVVTVTSATTFTIEFNNGGGSVTLGSGLINFNPSTGGGNAYIYATIPDFLSILAGRGYTLPAGTTVYSPVSIGGGQFAPQFHAAAAGSFTFTDTSVGPQTPANVTPITVTLPVKPIRPTYGAGAAFNLSISQGTLQKLGAGPSWNFHAVSFQNGNGGATGRATTLAGVPIRSVPYQGNRANLKQGFLDANPGINALSAVSGVRIVTVYDDDGTVLV